MGAGDIWEISIFSAQCCCETKIDLKSKVYFLKIKKNQNIKNKTKLETSTTNNGRLCNLN